LVVVCGGRGFGLAFGGRLGPVACGKLDRPQWLIAIGLFPLLLVLGLPISLSAPLANLVAVPWISLVVLPLALLGLYCCRCLCGEGLLWLAGGALDGLFSGLAWLAGRAAGMGTGRGAAGLW
jgi:competence protein ComEC